LGYVYHYIVALVHFSSSFKAHGITKGYMNSVYPCKSPPPPPLIECLEVAFPLVRQTSLEAQSHCLDSFVK